MYLYLYATTQLHSPLAKPTAMVVRASKLRARAH